MHRRLAVVVVALVAASACYGKKTVNTTARGAYQIEPIVNGSFIVEPRSFKPFKVTVAPGSVNPRVEGTFTASGANNDIEVMLLEASQFQNWEQRNKFTSAYQSGRVTADKLAVPLPPQEGTYYVVFSNRFSLISNKAVVADIVLHCDKGKKNAPPRAVLKGRAAVRLKPDTTATQSSAS
jgi:hypothetical protein